LSGLHRDAIQRLAFFTIDVCKTYHICTIPTEESENSRRPSKAHLTSLAAAAAAAGAAAEECSRPCSNSIIANRVKHTMSSFQCTSEPSQKVSLLTPRYLKRLGWTDDAIGPTTPRDFSLLQKIQEANLAKIPFENLSQHGCPHKFPTIPENPASSSSSSSSLSSSESLTAEDFLDLDATARKILDHGRGGFCYEVNLLLAAWLEELGYTVCRVPCVVFGGDIAGADPSFDHPTSHVVLIVTCPEDLITNHSQPDAEDQIRYYVEVGFGEPPIHPLRFENNVFGIEQRTAEGLRSRLDLMTLATGKKAVQLYFFKNQKWTPQLQWDYEQSLHTTDGGLEKHRNEFIYGIQLVLRPNSVFSQKLICCLLMADCKLTLAGGKFKVTQPRGLRVEDHDQLENQLQNESTNIQIDQGHNMKTGPEKITIK
jgi:arylamine N-acetyltransferase